MTETYRTIVVHTFRIADVEDHDLWAAEPLYKFEKSELGQWLMENCVEKPEWRKVLNQADYSYELKVYANLTEKQLTYYRLKYN